MAVEAGLITKLLASLPLPGLVARVVVVQADLVWFRHTTPQEQQEPPILEEVEEVLLALLLVLTAAPVL